MTRLIPRVTVPLIASSVGLAAMTGSAAAVPALDVAGPMPSARQQLAASTRDLGKKGRQVRPARPAIRACRFRTVMILNEANGLRKRQFYRIRYERFWRDHSSCKQYLAFRACRSALPASPRARAYRVLIVFDRYRKLVRAGRSNHHCPSPPSGN